MPPEKGYPPAHPESTGAKRYREEAKVEPPGQAELTQIVQDLPVSDILSMEPTGQVESRITHGHSKSSTKEDVPPVEKTSSQVKSQITHGHSKSSTKEDVPPVEKTSSQVKSRITHEDVPPVEETSGDVINVDELPDVQGSGRITRAKSQHPCVCPPDNSQITQKPKEIVIPDDDEDDDVVPFSITSETVKETTYRGESEKEKLNRLKRKMLPARKSPRVKIPKLDMKKGVSSGLPRHEKRIVEDLAKNIVSSLKQKPQEQQQQPLPGSRRQGPDSLSSYSCRAGHKIRNES